MKKLLSLILVLGLVLLYGCSGNDASSTDSGNSDNQSTVSDTISSDASSNTTSNTVSTPSEQELAAKQYLPGSWSNQVSTVRIFGEGKFVFGVQTDTHHSDVNDDEQYMRNLAAATYFAEYNFIANLGDLIRGYSVADVDSPENMRACMDDLVARYTLAKSPVLLTLGNHDANHMWSEANTPGDHTTLITEQEHFTRIIEPIKAHNGDNMVLSGEKGYYYMDFPEDSVRVVMLNTTDGKYSESFSDTSLVSLEQVEWFKTEALNTDKYVIVMSHIPVYPDGDTFTNNDLIASAVKDFEDKGGNFVGYFHGHTHERSIEVDPDGNFHMGFLNGGNPGETVLIDFEERKVQTVIMGNGERRNVQF